MFYIYYSNIKPLHKRTKKPPSPCPGIKFNKYSSPNKKTKPLSSHFIPKTNFYDTQHPDYKHYIKIAPHKLTGLSP